MAKRGWKTQQEKLDQVLQWFGTPRKHACGHVSQARHRPSGTCYECWLERMREHKRTIRRFQDGT